MILYNYDLDENCYRVRLVASCLGIKLELRGVDMFPGREHLSPALLALNPAGGLPILVDGDLVLTRTEAILLYLAETAGALLPQTAEARARMMDWLIFAAQELPAAVQARAVSMLNAPGDLTALQASARRALRLLDDHLTLQGLRGLGFVAGEAITLADLALFPSFALSRDFNLDHDEFPALRLWARRLRKTPGFVTMPGIPDYH